MCWSIPAADINFWRQELQRCPSKPNHRALRGEGPSLCIPGGASTPCKLFCYLGSELHAAPVTGDADLAAEVELVDVLLRVALHQIGYGLRQRVRPEALLLQPCSPAHCMCLVVIAGKIPNSALYARQKSSMHSVMLHTAQCEHRSSREIILNQCSLAYCMCLVVCTTPSDK